ncbi:MAG: hypothetical protein ACI4XA_09270 [Oscillospiraceae bacterium]
MQDSENKPRAKKRGDNMIPLDKFALMQQTMTDPQGMYTGVPLNPFEEPVQDDDDL